jgi:dihydrofolate reductase
MLDIIFLAAVAANGVIGNKGQMPWGNEYPEDLKRFKEITMGYPVVMGRKTWDSLPKQPLPYRANIVLTRKPLDNRDCLGYDDLRRVIFEYNNCDKLYVIGGSEIFNHYLEFATTLEITHIHKDYEGDVYFPEIDKTVWYITRCQERNGYDFVTYEKR